MAYRTPAMFLLLFSAAFAGPKAVQWHTDLDGALAEAKRTRRPVFVYVFDTV